MHGECTQHDKWSAEAKTTFQLADVGSFALETRNSESKPYDGGGSSEAIHEVQANSRPSTPTEAGSKSKESALRVEVLERFDMSYCGHEEA